MFMLVYDITDEKRLTKLASYLEGIGMRVQNSTFEFDVDRKEIKKIFKKSQKFCEDGDKIFIFKIKNKEDIQDKTDYWDMVL